MIHAVETADKREQTADGEIDAARHNHQCHTHRHDRDYGDLIGDVSQVAGRQKRRAAHRLRSQNLHIGEARART